MVVVCPNCKTKLKIDEAKIAPQGTRFKCPKCQNILTVNKPSELPARQAEAVPPPRPDFPSEGPASGLDRKKAMVAHADAQVIARISKVLARLGITSIESSDGVETMVATLKERPYFIFVDVALPKIYGYEVVKRLRGRPETKDMKAVFISSIYDKKRYRREPASLYGADDYIDEHEIEDLLAGKIRHLIYHSEENGEKIPERPLPPPEPERKPVSRPIPSEQQTAPAPQRTAPAQAPPGDSTVEKARRLARTILADIDLYAPEKVTNSIKNGSFETAFASELKEGKKIYEVRISQEIKNQGDFFKEAIQNFINTKKKSLGI